MHKQYLPVYISLILVTFVGLYLPFAYGRAMRTSAVSPIAHALNVGGRIPSVSNVAIHRTSPYTVTTIDYPYFTGELSVINAPIENMMGELIAQHEKNSKENWNARIATESKKGEFAQFPSDSEKFPLHATWSITQFDGDRMSLLIRYDEFSGGAHGSEHVVTYNYDMKQHRLLTLSDLYGGDPEYLNKVSSSAIDELIADRKRMTMQQDISDYELKWIHEGAAPKLENFRSFTTYEHQITFYFDQYQVGPYAIGMPVVTLYLPQ